jgi:hypothetical protein
VTRPSAPRAADKRTLVVPIVIITVGVGWLLTTLEITPGIDWIWTLGLAVVGILSFAAGGWNKATFVIGSFFVIASGLSVLRQTGRLQIDHEVPILVIVIGVLLLFARSPAIPAPEWILPEPPPADRRGT